MDNNKFDLNLSEGDLSIESILAEYDTENGIISRGKGLGHDSAANASEDIPADTVSDNREPTGNREPAAGDPAGSGRPIDEMLEKMRSESANDGRIKTRRLSGGAEAPAEVDDILRMAEIGTRKKSADDERPPVDMDELFVRPDGTFSKEKPVAPTQEDYSKLFQDATPTSTDDSAGISADVPHLDAKPAVSKPVVSADEAKAFVDKISKKTSSVLPDVGKIARIFPNSKSSASRHDAEAVEIEDSDGASATTGNVLTDIGSSSPTQAENSSDSSSLSPTGGDEADNSAEKAAKFERPLPTDILQVESIESVTPTLEKIFADDSSSPPTDKSSEIETPVEIKSDPENTEEAKTIENALESEVSETVTDTQAGEKYAVGDDYSNDESEEDERSADKPDIREKLMAPIIGLMALNSEKREKKRAAAEARRAAKPEETPPEMPAEKAALFYAQQSAALKFRCLVATVTTAILVYLSYGLPMPGLLGSSPSTKALVCLIFELVVMLTGLDIFSNGFLSIIRGKPGAESLIVVSALISAIDAIYIAVSGNVEVGLPYCGVSALSMTFALWGTKINCENYAISFFTAAQAKDPTVILSEAGIDEDGCALAKSKRPVTGFVRTAETADVFENTFRLFAPVLIAGCVILSLFSFLVSSSCNNFIQTLGATTSICASLSAFFGYALPLSVTAKRLARSGVAIAGYSGCAELGRLNRVVITDNDIFPARTVSVADISIAEGVSPQKVISYTGSMISASGMATAPAFLQLMRKNGCVMQKVEDFACHEGGGIIARINSEQVYVGTASFMRLMGVRLPKNAATRTSVYTAINDNLVGFFSINYTAVASVQRALVTLLSGTGEPVFAIRDFNITPMLLKQKFRLPSGSYDFPPFADRYRMSAPESEEKGTVCAMFSRGGLGAVAGLSRRGKKLYLTLRICSALAILGSVVGLVLMVALCWTGSFGSASCGNIITYMLLWLVPPLVISYGMRR